MMKSVFFMLLFSFISSITHEKQFKQFLVTKCFHQIISKDEKENPLSDFQVAFLLAIHNSREIQFLWIIRCYLSYFAPSLSAIIHDYQILMHDSFLSWFRGIHLKLSFCFQHYTWKCELYSNFFFLFSFHPKWELFRPPLFVPPQNVYTHTHERHTQKMFTIMYHENITAYNTRKCLHCCQNRKKKCENEEEQKRMKEYEKKYIYIYAHKKGNIQKGGWWLLLWYRVCVHVYMCISYLKAQSLIYYENEIHFTLWFQINYPIISNNAQYYYYYQQKQKLEKFFLQRKNFFCS